MFIAGRYEYRNKGVDMFIESMARPYFSAFATFYFLTHT